MFEISSPFGWRTNPETKKRQFHQGIDIRMPTGTPLRPVWPGRVSKVWLDDLVNGTAVRIDHGGGYQSSYVHLSALFVWPGDLVTWSTLLGLSGGGKGFWGKGRSTGPHLHLALWKDGEAIDPRTLIPLPAPVP